MKLLIIYDSLHGNTKKIADSISKSLDNSKVLSVEQVSLQNLKDINMLVVGSPTHGGTAKKELLQFLNSVPDNYLKDIYVASFDTRFKEENLNIFLKLLVKTIGYAATKILKMLENKGGLHITDPEGFFVKDTSGPLLEGEFERASKWGTDLKSKYIDLSKK